MPSKTAKPPRPEPRDRKATRRIAIVAFPGVTLLDISGPAQVFAELEAIELPGPDYSLSYLSTSGGLVPTDVGMMIDTAPITSIAPAEVDTLVIPGGPGIWKIRNDAALMDWIAQALPEARRIASVCLGAFALAWTGILDGKRAATHWRYCPRLQDSFPSIRVEPNAIFVKDGHVWSSAGVSAGIDLALAMIEEDFGHTIALDVAREDDAIAVRFVGADGLPGNPHNLVSSWAPGEPVWQGTIDGNLVAVQVRAINNGFRLAHQGFEVPVYVFTETEATSARLMPVVSAADTGKKLLCPMPGLVVSIAVTEGQEVKAGETLAVVEAMKMQNVLRAERDGTVKKIHAAAGATLAVDALILEFA